MRVTFVETSVKTGYGQKRRLGLVETVRQFVGHTQHRQMAKKTSVADVGQPPAEEDGPKAKSNHICLACLFKGRLQRKRQ